jgi:hypothetical protein
MTRGMVANVVQLVFFASRHTVSEDHLDAWQVILDGIDDGPDVLDVTAGLVRQGGFVTAYEVRRAVVQHRARIANLRALPEPIRSEQDTRAGQDWLRRIRAGLKERDHRL